jgi:hypothetical protein
MFRDRVCVCCFAARVDYFSINLGFELHILGVEADFPSSQSGTEREVSGRTLGGIFGKGNKPSISIAGKSPRRYKALTRSADQGVKTL